MAVGEIERQTQNRVVDLFQTALGYRYLGNWEERGGHNVEEEILIEWLQQNQGYSDALIKKALFEIRSYANDANRDLYYVNQDLYACLRYGVKVKETVDSHKSTVHFIDWQQPSETMTLPSPKK